MRRPAIHLTASLLGLFLVAGCSQPAAEGSVDRDIAAIRAGHAALDDAARRGDYAGWGSHFTQDDIILPPGRAAIEGQIEDAGKMLEIWRRQPDGRWLLARDIWNSDILDDR